MTRVVRAVCRIFVFSLTIGVAMAQMRNSTITGTVTDQSGAVVANATVRVTNRQTNTVSATNTNAAGIYTVPYLPQGEYKVTVEAPGFQTYISSGIVVATNGTVQADVGLTVGATRQMVEVKAAAAQLQTQSSTVAGGVGSHVIDTIPNITNNPLYYATLAAGVVPSPGMYDTHDLGVGFADRQEYSAIRINGGMVGTNDVQLDGVPVQEAAWHTAAVIPNSDALQEVRVQTNNLPADIGGGQGVIQMVTKSGTSSFHGDLNYVVRNEAFNANGFANDLKGIPKGKYRVNEGGGSIGGPVIIPKLINGKDKMFFFFAFDRLTNTQPVQFLSTVPTAAERQGDFSSTMIQGNNGSPTPVTIYNPWSAVLVPGSTNVYQRQPFLDANGNPTENLANAVLQPKSPFPGSGAMGAIDPYALLYFNGFPTANHGNFNGANSGTDPYNDNNYYFSGTAPTIRNNLNTRLDIKLGTKNSFYASGGMQNGIIDGANQWGSYGTNLGFYQMSANDISDFNPYVSLGDVITLNATTLIDLHVGMQRVGAKAAYPAPTSFDAAKYASYGMPAEIQQYIPIYGVAPSAGSFSNYKWGGSLGLNNDEWDRKNEHQTNWNIAGSITKVTGKWTLKGGADFRVYLGDWADIEFGTPALEPWDESANTTAQYADQSGNPYGAPYNTTPQQDGYWGGNAAIGTMGWRLDPGSALKPALAAKYMALFTQNDWKATNRLTLNLGLRYEVQPGPTERHNHIYDVDLGVINPYAEGFVSPGVTNPLATYGAFAFAGTGTYPRNLWDTQWNNISPRLGAEFRLTDSTALRGGWGRMYAPSNTGYNASYIVYGGAAFTGGTEPLPYGPSPNGLPVATFDQAASSEYFPAGGAVQAPDLYGNANGSANVDYFLRHGFKNAIMDQWNLTLEQRFHGWLASAGYVGSKGSDLGWRLYPLNGTFNIPDTTLQSWRSQWISSSGAINPAAVQIPNPLPALIGHASGDIGHSTISVMESEEGYLGLLGQTAYESAGRSMYNALELRLSHPFGNGLTTQFVYDWSHAAGLAAGDNGNYAESQTGTFGSFTGFAPGGGYNFRDLQPATLSFDTPQRFLGIVTYNPPFGKGKRFASSNKAISAVAGGWTLGTVVTLQSGVPWGPSCSSAGSQNGGCIPTGQPLLLPKSLRGWYNGTTPVTLPDGRTFTPPEFSYLYWNPDAFTAPVVQFPNGNYAIDQYWYGTTPTYMGSLRLPYTKNVNFTLERSVNLTERFKLHFLAQATNLFNNSNFLPGALTDNNFGNVFTSPGTLSQGARIGGNADPSAGLLNPTMMYGREITLSMRLIF